MGRINGSGSGVWLSGSYFDGRGASSVFSASRNGTGAYRISFANGILPDGYKVMLTGYGTDQMKGTVHNYNTTYFDVYTADDASRNDGSCEFMIFAPYWDYDLRNL